MIFGIAKRGKSIKQRTIDDNRISKQTSQKTIWNFYKYAQTHALYLPLFPLLISNDTYIIHRRNTIRLWPSEQDQF